MYTVTLFKESRKNGSQELEELRYWEDEAQQ